MNRYSPHYNHDENCMEMTVDDEGSWVHITKASDLLRERDEARAERDKYKAALDAELPAAWREDIESLNSCLERIGKERDEARAEVERLREVVRQVHALADVAVRGTAVWEPLVEIHKITKGMVE